VEPDLTPFQSMIDGIDKRFPLADRSLEPLFLQALAQRYRLDPVPASFRVIDAPLTTWVWGGGLLALLGGLVALWPARLPWRRLAPRRAALRRRVPIAESPA
jgi:cytochrome c-type biogenesis protein CcmF